MSTAETLKTIFISAGAGWIMWLLGVLSLISVGLIVERALYFRRLGTDVRVLAEQLDARLASRDFAGAAGSLQAHPSVAAAVCVAGLRLAEYGPGAADKAMHSALALARSRLERGLTYLGTLGNNAPFIGLFGTVIGIIGAFEELGHGAPGHGGGSGAAQVASQAVMSSISEALVATAVGLIVALPAVAAYNYFQRRMASLLSETEVLSNLVLAYLSGHTRKRATDPMPQAPVLTPEIV